MCRNCGCDGGRPNGHAPEPRTVPVRQAGLARNDSRAEENREAVRRRGLLGLNVLSAPGSGKTSFLERTLTDLRGRLRAAVVVGDLATDNDARRLRRSGAPVVQVTTGTVCHLDADMLARALTELPLEELDLLIV